MTENTVFSPEAKIASVQFIKERNYWTDKLSGKVERSYFPYDYPKTDAKERREEEVNLRISGDSFARLMKVCTGSDSKIHMILTAGVVALLSKYIYNNNDDFLVGTSIDKQPVDAEFINTILPLRVRTERTMNFRGLLLQVRGTVNEAIEHQDYSIESLMLELGITSEDDPSAFDVAVLLENIQEKKYIQHVNPSVTFAFFRAKNHLEGTLSYDARLYDKRTIRAIAARFELLVNEAIFNTEGRITDLNILSEEEKKQLLLDFNDTRAEFPENCSTIHGLFEAQVEKTPLDTAIIVREHSGKKEFTYREINGEANRLAHRLRMLGVTVDEVVPVMVEKPIDMIIGILGILKADGAYLPVDGAYPAGRIDFMLSDSGARILVGAGRVNVECTTLTIVDINDSAVASEDSSNPAHTANSSHAAYVIYTSGTTGRPKGTVVSHFGAVNTLLFRGESYGIGVGDVSLQLFSYSFDGFVTSFFTPIISGAAVVLMGKESVGDIAKIREAIVEDNITHFISVPVLFREIVENLAKEELGRLKTVTLAGDKVGFHLVETAREKSKKIEVAIEYGVTECSVLSTIYRHQERDDRISIGRPIANTSVYILGYDNSLQPPGVPGEMCIAGAGLARGYLNAPELTEQKFVSHPWVSGKKMYRTGDLARWSTDGKLEFLGRIDRQVKIRGYRIELEEIERKLLKKLAVHEAAVVPVAKAGGDALCACYVSESEFAVSELREHMQISLPSYMIPAYFVHLETLPRTVNGKVDREELSRLSFSMEINAENQYIPPTNELEERIAEIWKDVMNVEKVGIDDGYFALGGDSIKAIQISARLQKYKLKLELKDLFKFPTIRELALHIKPLKEIADQGVVEGEVRLTPVQEWFFLNYITDEHHFNQSVILHRPEGFKQEIIKRTFNELMKLHDAMRIVYKSDAGSIKQINLGIADSSVLTDMKVFNIEKSNDYEKIIEGECNELQSSIDLGSGPLVKLGLFKTVNGDYLLVAIHHLVFDGLSWRILFEDFTSLYQQIEKGVREDDLEIPLKTTSYKEWAEKLDKYSNSKEFLTELDYWRNLEEINAPALFKGNRNKRSKNKGSTERTFQLSEEYTEKLLKQVSSAYNTEINDILLAALTLALNDWIGAEKITMSLEGHGREDIIPGVDIARTIGWFTSAYPVVFDMRNKREISSAIINTKETLRKIPNKGIGYGILKYLTKEENKQGIEFRLNPGLSFNYLGQFDDDVNTGLFKAADISSGNVVSLNSDRISAIGIVGMVFDGKLRINVNYDNRNFEENEIRDMVNGYEKRLVQIIDHCTAKEDTELTLSDFTSSIEEQEAEQVFDILSEITLEG